MYRQIGENLSEVSRRYGIPVPTLYYWILTGKIKLPDDAESLRGAKKVNGRWYLQEKGKSK
jgi:transposase-like protein